MKKVIYFVKCLIVFLNMLLNDDTKLRLTRLALFAARFAIFFVFLRADFSTFDGMVSAKLAPVPATFLTKRTLLPIGLYNVLTKGTLDCLEFFLVRFAFPPRRGT